MVGPLVVSTRTRKKWMNCCCWGCCWGRCWGRRRWRRRACSCSRHTVAVYILYCPKSICPFCLMNIGKTWFISGVLIVKYWNINYITYYVKCSSKNCWFLVFCFFLVIWNISQINVFKTKCKLKCQNTRTYVFAVVITCQLSHQMFVR